MDHKADVTILSEANHDVAASKSLNCIETIFKNYRVESKPVNGTSNSRILLIINKDIEYERLKDLESNINSSIVIKIPQSPRKNTLIVGTYRQWKGVGSTLSHCSYSIIDQVH